MDIVVDTSVWSLVLRRASPDVGDPWVRAFVGHIRGGDRVLLPGPVLQELLDGMPSEKEFRRLRAVLAPFTLAPMSRQTYIAAAQLSNLCRSKGVQAHPTDALIAATCLEGGYPLLTADADFGRIARHCGLVLLPPAG